MQTFGAVVSLALITTAVRALAPTRTDQEYWHELAQEELQAALSVRWNTNKARNVILFIGDGMGPNTITATRIHLGGEGHRLVYETFPHVGLLKTYSANKMVPDSASTATALFCGAKANQETLGVDASVNHRNCTASLQATARMESLAALALRAGKRVGFVTTMRVTHATPAPLYAHSADRKWECDSKMPAEARASGCKDHARQLVEDWPGRDLHVIMGGGMQTLVANLSGSDPWGCFRSDGRDLIRDYEQDKRTRNLKYAVVHNNKQLNDVDVDNTDYLLGIFASGHMKYEYERDKGPDGSPSLAEMVETAIKVLDKTPAGYFLMVEGGNIDMAHHRGRAKVAVSESAALEAAVARATRLVDATDTLLVVTSDHTHTLTINGYPYRGTNIFGIASASPYDGVNYTTLSYGTGGPGSMHYEVVTDNGTAHARRRDVTSDDTDSYGYEQVAAIVLDENSHGGGDVVVYATGPHAHLFHSVHEQHYVFHAISYAARLGANAAAHPAHHSSLLIRYYTIFAFAICIILR